MSIREGTGNLKHSLHALDHMKHEESRHLSRKSTLTLTVIAAYETSAVEGIDCKCVAQYARWCQGHFSNRQSNHEGLIRFRYKGWTESAFGVDPRCDIVPNDSTFHSCENDV
jgi:hypothetical protein